MNDKRQVPQVPLMLSVPRESRDLLRVMAAKINLENPDQVTSAAQLAREILINYLDNVREKSEFNEEI